MVDQRDEFLSRQIRTYSDPIGFAGAALREREMIVDRSDGSIMTTCVQYDQVMRCCRQERIRHY